MTSPGAALIWRRWSAKPNIRCHAIIFSSENAKGRLFELKDCSFLAEWPYEAQSFDVIISNHVLEHLEDHVFVFRLIRLCLRPGGVSLHCSRLARWSMKATPTCRSFVRLGLKRKRYGEIAFAGRTSRGSRESIPKLSGQSGTTNRSVRSGIWRVKRAWRRPLHLEVTFSQRSCCA